MIVRPAARLTAIYGIGLVGVLVELVGLRADSVALIVAGCLVLALWAGLEQLAPSRPRGSRRAELARVVFWFVPFGLAIAGTLWALGVLVGP